MQITSTQIPDLYIIEPKVWLDARGYFCETYKQQALAEAGIHLTFIQDNQAKSSYGVIRGMHYQIDPHAQTKLIRVIQGKIIDAVVDLRPHSPSFGQSFAIELSDENHLQLLVPKGFAHGYSVLSDTAIVSYKVDAPYMPTHEKGISVNCPHLNIDWGIAHKDRIVSDKDATAPTWIEFIHS